ncbi:hypothetical protein ACLOJK_030065 [Asimina triloba]
MMEAKLVHELMVLYALNEGRHIHFGEEAWDFSSFQVESRHIISQWFVEPLADAHELGGSDRSLPLVAELGFKQVMELGARKANHIFSYSLRVAGKALGSTVLLRFLEWKGYIMKERATRTGCYSLGDANFLQTTPDDDD